MLVLAALVVAAAVGIGLGVYWLNDASQSEHSSAGSTDVADRVSVIATVEKVDPAQYTVSVRVWAVPRGRFTSDGGETANRDIRVLSSGLNGGGLALDSGRRIGAQTIPVELRGTRSGQSPDRLDPRLHGVPVGRGDCGLFADLCCGAGSFAGVAKRTGYGVGAGAGAAGSRYHGGTGPLIG